MWPIYGILGFKWIQLKNDFECAAESTDKSLEQFVGLHFTFQRIPQEVVERTNKTRYMAERVGGQRELEKRSRLFMGFMSKNVFEEEIWKKTSRERPKSASYLRLKNSKRTSKCQVLSSMKFF